LALRLGLGCELRRDRRGLVTAAQAHLRVDELGRGRHVDVGDAGRPQPLGLIEVVFDRGAGTGQAELEVAERLCRPHAEEPQAQLVAEALRFGRVLAACRLAALPGLERGHPRDRRDDLQELAGLAREAQRLVVACRCGAPAIGRRLVAARLLRSAGSAPIAALARACASSRSISARPASASRSHIGPNAVQTKLARILRQLLRCLADGDRVAHGCRAGLAFAAGDERDALRHRREELGLARRMARGRARARAGRCERRGLVAREHAAQHRLGHHRGRGLRVGDRDLGRGRHRQLVAVGDVPLAHGDVALEEVDPGQQGAIGCVGACFGQQRQGALGVAAEPRCIAAGKQQPRALRVVDRQARAALERACCRAIGAARLRALRGLFERVRRRRVGTGRRGGEVPRAPVDVAVRQRGRQRRVRGAALRRGGLGVDRRAHERVAELDAAAVEREQPGLLGGRQRRRIEPRAGQRPDVAGVVVAASSSMRRAGSASRPSRRANSRAMLADIGTGPSAGSAVACGASSSSASGFPAVAL
jgi:hypothetical protein